jgi:type IV secretion system protein TrbL
MSWWSDAGVNVASGLTGIVAGIVGHTAKAAHDVVKTVEFAKDPAGYITSLLQQGVYVVATKLIPPMIDALHPDYTADWWIDSYRVSFGMAFLLAAVLLVVSFVQTQKGKNSGKELAETLFVALPGFVIAAAFGPLVGQLVGKVFVQLEDSIAIWSVSSSTKDYFTHLGDAAASDNAQALWGTALISQITLEGLLLGMIVVVFVLLIQLATMYLTGALMSLFLVWLVNPRTRHLAKIGPTVWIALNFAHALMILLVGIVFRAVGGLQMKAVNGDAGDFAVFVNLALPAVLICMIIFAPMALLKIASPATAALGGGGQSRDGGLNSPNAGSVPQLPTRNGNGGGGGQSGPQSPNDAASTGSGGGKGWTPSTQPAQASPGGGGSTTVNATGGSAANQAAQQGGKKTAQAAAQKGATSAAGKTATAGTAATGVGAPIAVGAVLANAALKAAATAVRAGHQAAEQAGDAGTHD